MAESASTNEWYENYYSRVNISATGGSRVSNLYHKLLERNFRSNFNHRILEVGANKKEHFNFVVDNFTSYVMTDIRESSDSTKIRNERVEFRQADVEHLPFDESVFNRVISTCVFHHVANPEKAFEEVRRVLVDGGFFSLMLPNDPGLAYRFFRGITSLRRAQKFGVLNMAKLAHAREHRNHYLSLLTILNWVFREDEISVRNFPFGLPVYGLNLLTIVTIKVNKQERQI
jgi:phosphatidylethanolamine/phosphatidyl-N-methylethanolamine N-methyltransferase